MRASRLLALTVTVVACQMDRATSPDELPAPQLAVTATVTHSDDFEDAVLSPFWTVTEQFGSVALSADQAHSGAQSVRMSSRGGGQRGMVIEHVFPELLKGSVSVWLYDTKAGQDGLYAGFVANSHLEWGQPGFHYFFATVIDWDRDWYHAGDGIIPYGILTTVRRTVGWHQFRIEFGADAVTIFVDNVRVAEFGGDFAFDRVGFAVSGPSWRPDATFYWDDVAMEVYPAASTPNQPPTADAGRDETVECASPSGAPVALDGSGSTDADGSISSYEWLENGAVIGNGPSPTVTFGLGVHVVTLRVTDDDGATAEDDVSITVRDTQAPTIHLIVNPTELWPPNHEMRLVASRISASDACDPAPVLAIEVASNEPADGLGDGDGAPDWQLVPKGDGTFDLLVRAERSGTGSGRLYSLTATASDASGNRATASATVTVPHSRGRGSPR